MQWMDRSARWIQDFLNQPKKVFWFCLFFSMVSLLFNGGFIRLYSLHRDQASLHNQIADLKIQLNFLDSELKTAKDPAYIQRQALDRYDFAGDQDLVFVFADE